MLTVWRNLWTSFGALLRDRRGNVAMIFGFSLIPMLLAAGVAVDYSRGLMVRQRLTSALDAAALAVGRSTGLNQTQMDALAQSYFNANYPDSSLGTPTPVSVAVDGNLVTVTGHAAVSTTFMSLVGYETMNVNVASQVTKETTGLDLVLVLDTTGSMGGSTGKIETLRGAATDLVNTLFGDSQYPEFLKIGIVPFTIGVRFDTSTYNQSWIDTAGESSIAQNHFSDGRYAWWLYNNADGLSNTSWLGCVEVRPLGADGHTLDETDTPPDSADTRWVPYFQPDEPHIGEPENTYGSPDWNPASPDQAGIDSYYSDDYIKLQLTVITNVNKTFRAVPAFTVLTFSTTSTTKNDDKLTVSSHGLATGDGPIRIYGSSLPAPLSNSTDYWVINTDSGKIRLAESYENAVAPVPIPVNITGSSSVSGFTNVLKGTHYMETGNGPFQVRSSGTLPTGLATNTDYWLIKMSANRFRLATSAALAASGTGVAITASGSGTHQTNTVYTTAVHDLVTGAGPFTVSGTLPGGLSTGTDYWVTKINDYVFQFATSHANATANPPVNVALTSIGGSSTLIMPGVSVTNDTLTATANHGMTTGEGPVRLMSTGTLPGGIPGDVETNGMHGATDYWIVVVNNNTVKLAPSRANALNGTSIVDITSTGSGTIYTAESPGGTTQEEQEARQKDWRKYVGRTYSGASGPNSGCDMQPMTPLTNDKATLLTKIAALNAAGNTHIPLGLAWGWRMISPDAPFTEGVPYTNDNYIKAIVLMTDGDNTMPSQNSTINGSQYTSYGYAKDERLGAGIDTGGEMPGEMDESLKRICSNIKAIPDSEGAERIKIFTIAVQISNATTNQMLDDCATDDVPAEDLKYFFKADDNAALTAAFQQIATQLSNLRISH